MKSKILQNRDLARLQSLRLQTVIAEAKPNRKNVLRLVVDPGVQGLIVVLKPALPIIS